MVGILLQLNNEFKVDRISSVGEQKVADSQFDSRTGNVNLVLSKRHLNEYLLPFIGFRSLFVTVVQLDKKALQTKSKKCALRLLMLTNQELNTPQTTPMQSTFLDSVSNFLSRWASTESRPLLGPNGKHAQSAIFHGNKGALPAQGSN